MRKYVKKKALELVTSLGEGNELLRGMFEKNEQDNALSLLQEAQETALFLGNEIEQSEGEEHPIISLFEEYCELLWQCSQQVDREQQIKLCKLLQKKCVKIGNSLKWDVKVQYDVVFMPYNASMWDSLESVWLAAKEDEDCNCYVIPIPYYDRNPDKTLGRMHYEGHRFPDYVPITDYHSYDIQTICPEVIFIHNPYDECNYVTSVHPDYYSTELKKSTEMLVYIPYFITMGDVAYEMCVTPGVVNADKVIVQSEKVREAYIKHLEKFWSMVDPKGKSSFLYDQIVALGSPKIDKVLNTKLEDIVLPKEWEEKIYGKATCSGA